jgi:hypothetical protein
MITHPVTDRDLARFCAKLDNKHARYFAENYANLTPPIFTFEKGRKYVRIVRNETFGQSGGRAVTCFVELATGLIWKAASWKAPAKNFHRGSIYMANKWTGGFNIYNG